MGLLSQNQESGNKNSMFLVYGYDRFNALLCFVRALHWLWRMVSLIKIKWPSCLFFVSTSATHRAGGVLHMPQKAKNNIAIWWLVAQRRLVAQRPLVALGRLAAPAGEKQYRALVSEGIILVEYCDMISRFGGFRDMVSHFCRFLWHACYGGSLNGEPPFVLWHNTCCFTVSYEPPS